MIQYVRIDDPTNLDGLKAIVERGMEMGFYQGVNFDSMFCNHCGHHTTPKHGKIVTCADCGSHDVTVISRVCGYLGYSNVNGNTRFNESKLDEVRDRVSM